MARYPAHGPRVPGIAGPAGDWRAGYLGGPGWVSWSRRTFSRAVRAGSTPPFRCTLGVAPAAAETVGLATRRVGGSGHDHGADRVPAAAADRAGPAGLCDLLGGARARVDGLLDSGRRHAEAEADVHLRSRAA